MKGVLLDGTSLMHFSIAMGVVNDDDRENMPIEEGEKILFPYRLTRVIHIADSGRADALNCAALQKF